MSNVDWSKAPEGAEFYSWGSFFKKVDGVLCYYREILDDWPETIHSVSELYNKTDFEFKPTISVTSTKWPETDERISAIAQNGNDGLHYNAPERTTSDESAKPKSKYHRIIKGVEIDLYDVLKAYGVTCPALAHAIKKAMLPGARHAKSFEQDIDEAIASMERAKELANE